MSTRLGQIYRTEYLKNIGLDLVGDKILDIGCHNGAWLSNLNARIRIGLDITPIKSINEISFVKADAISLPFPMESFDIVYLLDVIEHIENDIKLINQVMRIIKRGGKLILSTPNINMRIFPGFLTEWISNKWGHTIRKGYDPQLLSTYFGDGTIIEKYEINSYWFRNLYIPLRITFTFFPNFSSKIIRLIVNREAKNLFGSKGFLLFVITKN
jgi:ubiquinone/menaquinone biosynthesis C-methylase UbiE